MRLLTERERDLLLQTAAIPSLGLDVKQIDVLKNTLLSKTRNALTAWFHFDGWEPDKTGSTYINTSLQQAINAVIAAGGGTLYVAPGRYKIDARSPVYINTPDQSTPFKLLGEFTDAELNAPTGHGTVFFSDQAGDMFRVNLKTDKSPYNNFYDYQFNTTFEGMRFEGTSSKTTYAIRAYRTRFTMSRISAAMIDGIMIQDRTAPAGYSGEWNNYCDQGLYTDIRMVNMKSYGLDLCLCDNTVMNGIRYQYPAVGAINAMRLYYGCNVRINGFLYSDGQHVTRTTANDPTTSTLQTIIEVEGGSGFSGSGFHVEECDAAAMFSFINTNGIAIEGLHERFRGRTLFKFVGSHAATITAWNSWATRDGGSYDIDANATSSDINYSSSYVTTFNAGDASLTRPILFNDPNSVISDGTLSKRSYTASTAYTLALADSGKVLDVNTTAPTTITIPTTAAVPFMVGTKIRVVQYGTGQITVVAADGTIALRGRGTKTRGNFSEILLEKRQTGEWMLSGDLETLDQVINIPDGSNYTIPSAEALYILPQATAYYTLTAPAVITGKQFKIWNKSSASPETWYVSAEFKKADGSQLNSLANQKVYIFEGDDQGNWVQIN